MQNPTFTDANITEVHRSARMSWVLKRRHVILESWLIYLIISNYHNIIICVISTNKRTKTGIIKCKFENLFQLFAFAPYDFMYASEHALPCYFSLFKKISHISLVGLLRMAIKSTYKHMVMSSYTINVNIWHTIII